MCLFHHAAVAARAGCTGLPSLKLGPAASLRCARGGSRPEPFVSKRSSGSRLQIIFELSRSTFIIEGEIADNLPGTVFRRVNRCAFVIGFEALFQVAGDADVALSGIGNADQKVDVEHCPPARIRTTTRRKPAEARAGCIGPPSLMLRLPASLRCARGGWLGDYDFA